ncbi:hydroxymethylglutaryl-CoA lyase [Parahaliea maris]|uniref:Hydroxymethylglutaryl-CoA lyase n=1 Tax=Parahaliea maris TaxID=2716870 RepID=A0A5C8ZPH9_9GAMM|nr:hydroxymethylglutaryl-CoA lyase [Parahaliea maris]TXS89529.1 hydroxymethylglutaryl-CoA lyase [Parahaliea maris]
MNSSAERVTVNEVGPRDGLQNQDRLLSPADRVRLINSLCAAGLPSVEVGAFVSPRAVPAMAGTDEVCKALPMGDTDFSVLIPNRRGYELACDTGCDTVNLVVAASNTLNEKNIRMSTADAMAVSREVIALAQDEGVRVQAYVATAWACPFEGVVPMSEVLRLSAELLEAGAETIVLADTIGAAAPGAVRALCEQAVADFGSERLVCHFHDTRAFGVANVYAALEAGIRRFDASIGGLGGCPFAPGASGNVATEDVVLLLGQEGFATGIDLAGLLDSVELARELTGACVGGRAYNWLKLQAEKGRLQGDRVVSA